MTETEKKLRAKAGDRADELVAEVKQSPNYFVNEGGADGTFAHVRFLDEYGPFLPEISDLAVEFGAEW